MLLSLCYYRTSDDLDEKRRVAVMEGPCRWYIVLAVVAPLLSTVSGHGRLMEPPSRGSMWRQGFPSPINYADNQLFCGGFKHQWEDQNGRCGVCGDPYDGPREHEPGGKFYSGIITRTYTEGQVIDITVDLTAFHHGYFEFRLCPLEYKNQTVGQDCFNKYTLQMVTTSESKIATRYKLPDDSSTTAVKLKASLPQKVTCEQCVLQWKYHAANSWGENDRGVSCLGCGAQEEFYGCSDVRIVSLDGSTNTVDASGDEDNAEKSEKTSTKVTIASTSNDISKDNNQHNHQDDWVGMWSARNPTNTQRQRIWSSPIEPKSVDSLTKMKASLVGKCYATGAWKGQSAMDDWCVLNCERGHCPKSHCLCERNGQQVEPFYSSADQPWTSYSRVYPKMYSDEYGSNSRRNRFRRTSPANKAPGQYSAKQPQYLTVQPGVSGNGFLGDIRIVNQAHNDAPPSSMEDTQKSKDAYHKEPIGNSRLNQGYDNVLSKNDINDIMAYSQQTFHSIKDQAEAAYRSVMGRDVPGYPDGFFDNYNSYGGGHPPMSNLHTPSNRLYRTDGYGLTRHIGKPSLSHPSRKPEGKSWPSSQNSRYLPLGSQAGQFQPVDAHRNSNSNYKTYAEGELARRARFLDDGARQQPEGKSLQGSYTQPGDRINVHCIASGSWAGQAPMNKWCQGNCPLGNCPPTHCKCM